MLILALSHQGSKLGQHSSHISWGWWDVFAIYMWTPLRTCSCWIYQENKKHFFCHMRRLGGKRKKVTYGGKPKRRTSEEDFEEGFVHFGNILKYRSKREGKWELFREDMAKNYDSAQTNLNSCITSWKMSWYSVFEMLITFKLRFFTIKSRLVNANVKYASKQWCLGILLVFIFFNEKKSTDTYMTSILPETISVIEDNIHT